MNLLDYEKYYQTSTKNWEYSRVQISEAGVEIDEMKLMAPRNHTESGSVFGTVVQPQSSWSSHNQRFR